MPAPLDRAAEQQAIQALAAGSEEAASLLIEHNLRLVVYIARRFENTGIHIEDLISIGTIGLIKAIHTFKPDKNIKLATYASRCIENEILMYLRKCSAQKTEVSIDEPLNTDWDGNELLLSDILGTDADAVSRPLEDDAERAMLLRAIETLGERDRQIILLRFGIGGARGDAKRGRGSAGHLAELHQPARKAHHRAPASGNAQADAVLKICQSGGSGRSRRFVCHFFTRH